ncbi:MAG: TonB-dependent receptor [Bacteroidetes bacterium]|nr:MAG: TonB-dependent receptor [Bacteroidota bacterium]
MKCIFSLLALLGVLGTKAQTISGTVTAAGGKPLASATVALYKAADTSLLKSGVCGADGSFSLAYQTPQAMLLRISAIGYADTLLPANANMGAMVLQPAAQTLAGVVVSAKKPMIEVKADKLIFNVENSINAAGGNALELLRKSPGVLVDKDDNVIMGGKNGVVIYIDGKPTPLAGTDLSAYLRTVNSNDVELIEIITNPSARYDASGNAGIINIKLKKNKNFGWNGNVNSGYAIGIFPKYNVGGGVNYRNKKVNFFSSYSINKSRNQSFMNLYRLQNDSVFDQRSTFTNRSLAHNAKLGADFFITKKQTLGVLLNGNFSTGTAWGNSSTPISAQNTKDVNRVLVANSSSSSQRNNITANINYRYADTLGRELTVDADYGSYRVQSDGVVPNVYTNPATGQVLSRTTFGTITPVNIQLYSLKADFVQNLWKGVLTSGFKVSVVKTDNDFQFLNYNAANIPVRDENLSNRFIYTENINAFYGQYTRQINKWNYQVGLRAEQTNSEGDLTSAVSIANRNVKRNYLDWFPSAGISVQANQKNNYGLSYSRRIDRPRYQDLNPFESRIDELTYQKGNPFLRPQYTHIVELRHTFNYSLTSTLSYSAVQDVFAQVTDTIEGSRNFLQQRNLASQQVLSANVSYPFNIAKWWGVYASANLYYQRFKANFENAGINLQAFTATLYQQHTFTLKKGWSAEVSSYYNSPGIWGGTYKTKTIWGVDAGIMKKFWNDNANLKLSVTDIGFTYPWRGVNDFGGLYIRGNGGWESRQFRINFSCRLGNKQVKAARSRNTGLDDLKERAD